MGNCFGGTGAPHRINAAEKLQQEALSRAFGDAQVVIPWTLDLNLLSVLIEEPRSKLGFYNVGSLAGFVSDETKKEALRQLTTSLHRRTGTPDLQKVVKNLTVTRSQLAELCCEADPIGVEATLGGFMSAGAKLELNSEQHYLTYLDYTELQDAVRQAQLDTSPGSAARISLTGWEKGEVVIYVVDKIYQTTSITLVVEDAQAMGGQGGAEVRDLHIKTGLRIQRDKAQATRVHIGSAETDGYGNPVPFCIAFGCRELTFDGQGKLKTIGFTKLPFRAASASGPKESTGGPSDEERRPRLGTKNGGIVRLIKEEETTVPRMEESPASQNPKDQRSGKAQKRAATENPIDMGGAADEKPVKQQKREHKD